MSISGPITEEGKAVSSRNATRHGILAMVPVVPGMEQEADWEAHRAGIFHSLSPEGHLEEVLADRVALQLWRLHRVARYEAGTIAGAQQAAEDEVAERQRQLEEYESSPWYQLQDAKARLADSRKLFRRIRDLLNQPDAAPLTGPEAADVAVELEGVTKEGILDTISVPFLQQGEYIEDRSEWTAAELRELLIALAAADGQDPQQLIEKALEHPREQLDWLEQRFAKLTAQVEQDRIKTNARVQRLRQERLLLSEQEMDKVGRYEAHLSRELYKAMHELEALQARRHGRSSPLARLDITGLPPG